MASLLETSNYEDENSQSFAEPQTEYLTLPPKQDLQRALRRTRSWTPGEKISEPPEALLPSGTNICSIEKKPRRISAPIVLKKDRYENRKDMPPGSQKEQNVNEHVYVHMGHQLSETSWKSAKKSNRSATFEQFSGQLFKNLEPLGPTTKAVIGIQTLLIVGQTVWAGCLDGSLSVWDIRTGIKIGSRQAHKARIFSMLLVHDRVWTASDDSKIKIWNFNVCLCKEVTNTSLFRVSCMMEYGNKIWFGSLDSSIRIIDVKSFKCTKEVPSVGYSIRHLFKHRDQVWICTDENVIRINANTYQGLNTLKASRINCIVNTGAHIWGCSSDSTIYVWNTTGDLVKTISEHQDHVFSLLPVGNFVWSAGWDKTIRIWNARSFELVKKMDGNNEVVSSLILVRNRLQIDKNLKVSKEIYSVWSGAWDGSLCVWVYFSKKKETEK